jgi:hypothetical protein
MPIKILKMNINRFTLETYTEEMHFDSKQRKSVERCPFCGKGNRDGKFVPYRGFTDRGHCYSCGKYSPIGKHICPGCHLVKSFNRYIDTENSNQYLSDEVGKCLYCDYHYPPKQYFEDTKNGTPQPKQSTKQAPTVQTPAPPREPSFIDANIFKKTFRNYEGNNFVKYLINLFGEEITSQLIAKYFIGTSKHWLGSTIFWQIDTNGKIRTGKIMQYDAITGKRIKEPFSHIDWVHTVLKQPGFELKQCLFGEHLLKDISKPVAIVEAEKTAIIASVYLPGFIWLSCCEKDGLSLEKCSVLKGRTVILYPDLSCFELWKGKAKELSDRMPGTRVNISDLLETNASEAEKEQGLDLADYLIRFELQKFITESKPPQVERIEVDPEQFPKSEKGESSENIIYFSIPVQVHEDAINWYNGHLLPSIDKQDITNTLRF